MAKEAVDVHERRWNATYIEIDIPNRAIIICVSARSHRRLLFISQYLALQGHSSYEHRYNGDRIYATHSKDISLYIRDLLSGNSQHRSLPCLSKNKTRGSYREECNVDLIGQLPIAITAICLKSLGSWLSGSPIFRDYETMGITAYRRRVKELGRDSVTWLGWVEVIRTLI